MQSGGGETMTYADRMDERQTARGRLPGHDYDRETVYELRGRKHWVLERPY